MLGQRHAHPHRHSHHRRHVAPSPEERKADIRRIFVSLLLTAVIMVGEGVGGLWSGSWALVADAGHMLTDVVSLLLALLAMWFAARPADVKRTYGYYRLEILAALVNGFTLFGISVAVSYEAYQRILSRPEVKAPLMMAVAVAGLLVNLFALSLLSRSKGMNVRAAFLHIVSDAVASVGVIGAAGIIWATGWSLVDPVVSIGVAVLIVISALGLVREAVDVLLEAVPPHVELEEVQGGLREVLGVLEVHDLHIWTISSGIYALSAHLVVGCDTLSDCDNVLTAAKRMLVERFGIDHTTIQIESRAYGHVGEVH